MSEQNKALIRRAVEDIWNGGNYAAFEDLVSPDFRIYGSTADKDLRGRDAAIAYFQGVRAAFPDLHFEIDDLIAEGDRVVTRWSASGTHLGDFQGIPPTGRRIKISGTDVDRIANGRVVECWPQLDELGLLQQLGAVPETTSVDRVAD